MSKKGFTLVELLATIIIIGLIMGIVLPSAMKVSKDNQNTIYNNYETMIEEYAKVSDFRNLYYISLNDLEELKYKIEGCTGYVTVDHSVNPVEYKAYISCGDKYHTDGYTENIETTLGTVDVPSCLTNVYYNGQYQSLVPDSSEYEVVNGLIKNTGKTNVTIRLKNKKLYVWNNNSQEDQVVRNCELKPRQIVVTAKDKEMRYLDNPPVLESDVTNKVAGENPILGQVVLTVRSGTTDVPLTNNIPPGSYSIVPSAEVTSNYSVKLNNGTLKVLQSVFDVTLNNDGATTAGDTTIYEYYQHGWYNSANLASAITTITVPSKTGYTFNGYFTSQNGNGKKVINSSGKILATADLFDEKNEVRTLYASWSLTKYTISYTLNGGDVTGNPTEYYVTTDTITLKNPTKGGYTFTGWTGSNGTTAQTMVKIQKGSTGNKSYTANWDADKYTVTYNYTQNGGTSATQTSASVAYNGQIDVTTPTATKGGWTFVGWNTNKDATTKLTSLTMGTSNVTLYAIFKKVVSISFDLNNASKLSDSSGSATSGTLTRSCTIWNNGTTCNITSPTITASTNTPTVVGFNTSATATTSTWNQNVAKGIDNSATWYAITKNTTPVTITFKANGATKISDSSGSATSTGELVRTCYKYNGSSTCNIISPTITPPSSTPTIIGYRAGSSTGTNSSDWNHNTSKAVSSDTTYYAITRKDAITHTVTFKVNGAGKLSDSSGSVTTGELKRTCTRAAVYNGASNQATSCNITSPKITGSTKTPTVIGYNTSASSTTSAWTPETAKSFSSDETYYAVTKKDAVSHKIKFIRNGAQSLDGTSANIDKTCSRDAVYNGADQPGCSITSPTIVGSTYTPTVVGFNTSSNATSSTWTHGTAKSITSDATYYAITRKDAVTYTVAFNPNGVEGLYNDANQVVTDNVTKSCTIAATYNGQSQTSSCNITTPKMKVKNLNYGSTRGYSTSSTLSTSNTIKHSELQNVSIEANATYYAIAYGSSISVKFYRNGAQTLSNADGTTSTSTYVTRSCYPFQGNETCSITSPIITATTQTPTVVGFRLGSGEGTNTIDWAHNTSKTISSSDYNKSYYAITRKNGATYTFNWKINGASQLYDSTNRKYYTTDFSTSCSIPAIYNGSTATQATSCKIKSPTIYASGNTSTVIGYNTSATGTTSEWNQSTERDVNYNGTYYAITKDDYSPRSYRFYLNGAAGQYPPGSSTPSTDEYITVTAYKWNGSNYYRVTTPTIVPFAGTVIGYHHSRTSRTSVLAHNSTIVMDDSIINSTSGDTNFYAITYRKGGTTTLTYNPNGGTLSNTGSVTCDQSDAYNTSIQSSYCTMYIRATANRTNYRDTTTGYTGQYTLEGWKDSSGAIHNSNTTVKMYDNMTLTAVWSLKWTNGYYMCSGTNCGDFCSGAGMVEDSCDYYCVCKEA